MRAQGYITENSLGPPDHVERVVLAFVKRVMRFAARAAGPAFGRSHGAQTRNTAPRSPLQPAGAYVCGVELLVLLVSHLWRTSIGST